MNRLSKLVSFERNMLLAVLFLSFFVTSGLVSAQSVTFAQVVQVSGGQDFVFTNTNPTATFTTVPGGTPVFFFYQNIVGLDPSLNGIQNAVMTISSSTSTPSTLSGGILTQPVSNITTVQVTRNTPATVGNGTRTNLLTAIFVQNSTSPALAGNNGGNSATFSATTPNQTVTFSSDFITFFATTDRNLGLSFSSVNPPLSQGAGGFLSSFTAAGTATFASNPAPVPFLPPSAATVSVGGRVVDPLGNGISRVVVEMVDPVGNSQKIQTNSFGYFRFDDVEVGNFYLFNATAKVHTFQPAVLTVNESVSNLIFVSNK